MSLLSFFSLQLRMKNFDPLTNTALRQMPVNATQMLYIY